MKIWSLIVFPFVLLMAEKPHAELITDLLQKQNWDAAEKELVGYIKENPRQAWAYTSRAWALENLRRYDEGIAVVRDALRQWPQDTKVKTALGRLLIKKAEAMPAREAQPLFIEAAAADPRDYTEFCLARSYRNLGAYAEALAQMENGLRRYPNSQYFREGLPFTRYQYFKTLRATGDKAGIRAQVDAALSQLLAGHYEQFYYQQILRLGLRDLGDRKFFQATYDRLFARHPQNAALHDDYGFQLYANYRVHGRPDQDLKETAISWRRKAYDLYWKSRPLPKPVKDLGFPLKGRNIVWSEFGGSAMTHNGLSQYCYDFAAVDLQKNNSLPGSTRQKNSDYYMFGKPVFAVADGIVAGVINEFPDNEPGGYSGDANTITLKHQGYFSFYAHLKANGVIVREGQKVKKGTLIGYVGNSGMSSESHLHFCINAANGADVTIPFNFAKTTVETKAGRKSESDAFYKEGDVVTFK